MSTSIEQYVDSLAGWGFDFVVLFVKVLVAIESLSSGAMQSSMRLSTRLHHILYLPAYVLLFVASAKDIARRCNR